MFGAYTDINWTANVSAPKFGYRNSFIFGECTDSVSFQTEDAQSNFVKFKVKSGYEEAFSSDKYGPNFYDLKLSGPDQQSSLDCLGNHYYIPASLVSDDYQPTHRGKIQFQYKMMEVFSVDTSQQQQINIESVVRSANFKRK